METQETLYDAIAVISPNGEPMLGDAQVILGDGTTKVMFKHGRAKVTAQVAEMLVKRGDVDIPGFTPGIQPREVTPEQPIQAAPLPAGAVVNGDGTITLPASALTDEQREAVRQALEIAPVEHETVKPQAGDEAAVAAAKEYLAEEGETVPEPEADALPTDAPSVPEVAKTVTIPEGFQAKTAEGEPRCIARKSDGSQCANAAKGDTLACGLKKHQESVLAD